MDWGEFWVSAVSGIAAAVVGFVSAATAFVLNRRAERKDAAERERSERIARVQAIAHGEIPMALLRYGSREISRVTIKFVEALTAVGAAELREHEPVALWVFEQVAKIGDSVAVVERTWIPALRVARGEEFMEAAIAPGAALSLWESGTIDDSWFAERLEGSVTRMR